MKAKITTNLGSFEFEGTEEFVEKQIENIMAKSSSTPIGVNDRQNISKMNKKNGPQKERKKLISTQPKMLPNLINGKEELEGLRSFYAEKGSKSHMEIFAVICLWLRENKQLTNVSVDEIWTAYKILGERPPKAMLQVFRDGKSKKGYFDVSPEAGKYYLTSYGETFVEHDLKPKKANK